MSESKTVRFGVIGCGLMGREFASAAARWCHIDGVPARPEIVAVCDPHTPATHWFRDKIPTVRAVYADHRELLADDQVDAIYCAVPHDLHETIYIDILNAGKHLLGEKPFGIDRQANESILSAVRNHPDLLVRCSSEFPYVPGAYRIGQWLAEGRFGRIIEVEAGFWHSSDLNPKKPINWKRMIAHNGEYGCMGDLGMHALHMPLRAGFVPHHVRAQLTNIVTTRPGPDGQPVPCETWDNAILSCDIEHEQGGFPMTISVKRIAPGHANTWFIRVLGTEFSCEFSTRDPKRIRWMPYTPGGEQAWHEMDTPHQSAYPSITGGIFEFGFSDSILQMWAAFLDELVSGRDGMQQPFYCATPEEAATTHAVFTAALESHRDTAVVPVRHDPAFHPA